MCGIAGYVGRHEPGLGLQMATLLEHRGPDDGGEFVAPIGETDRVAVLAHRRLAIIDIPGGRQPLANEDGTIHVVFNGEIYNFRDLERELVAHGHRLRTRCDTEVIVHLYEEHGLDFVHRLRGMFALALWDAPNRRLVLARDRLGVKPLYYAQPRDDRTEVAFASEPRPLLRIPGVSRDVDLEGFAAYLAYLYVPHPMSGFRDIRKLPPAHLLVHEGGRTTIRRYWAIDPSTSAQGDAETVWGLVEEAVAIRLVADVRVGAYLSGGIDSSSIVAAASARRKRFPTFTVVFERHEDRFYDESEDARVVADAFDTEHHELQAQPDLAGLLPTIVRHFGEPFGNPTALLAHALAERTRSVVKVALDGAGSDELFAGYERFRGLRLLEWYGRAPTATRALAARGARALPESTRGRHALRRGREFLLGPTQPDEAYVTWITYFDETDRARLLASGPAEQLRESPPPETFLYDLFALAPRNDVVNRVSFVELQSYLPCNVLEYGDRMSMAHGLELREPYCDHILAERVFALPGSAKLRRLRTKAILREALASRLPAHTLAKRKVGFNPPIGVWLSDLSQLVDSHLSPERVRERDLLRPEAVASLVAELRRGRRDVSLRVWSLIVLEEWLRQFVDDAD